MKLGLLRRWHRHEKLRFLVVGGWNTAFGYLAFVGFYTMLHEYVNYLLIAVTAHVAAVINAFVCHRLFVFQRRGPWQRDFFRFNLSQLAVLGCGLIGLWLLVSVSGLRPLVAQFLLMMLSLVFSYLMHRHFSFAAS